MRALTSQTAYLAATMLLLVQPASASLNPAKAITQYIHDAWTSDSGGLPQNTVVALAQTPDGYLWAGTEAGLVRFDGVEFKTFNKDTDPAFHANEIDSLLVDHTGVLWIGTRGGGLTRFENGRFESFSASVPLPSGTVQSLYEDPQGDLWIAIDGGGLGRLHKGRLQLFTRKDGLADLSAFSVCGDGKNGVWIGTTSGLSHWSNGAITTLTERDGLPGHDIRAVHYARNGALWIGTNGQGLARLDASGVATITTANGLSGNNIFSLLEDDAGAIWVGTIGHGLSRIYNGQISHYTSHEGLSGEDVWAFLFDREGSLWIGSAGGGLNRLRDGRFVPFGQAEGLASDVTLGVFEDRAGNLWLGSPDAGVTKLAPHERPVIYKMSDGLAGNQVFSITEDAAGDIWFGTDNGVSRLRGKTFYTYHHEPGLPPVKAHCVYADSKNRIWIAGRSGVTYFDGKKFTTFTTADGLVDNNVYAVYEDKLDGSMWFGTANGLSHWTGKGWRSFVASEGLPADSIWAIHGEKDGTIWLGGNIGGLIRYSKGHFISASTKNGLLDDEVFSILEDGNGTLWMSSNHGVFSLAKSEFTRFADHQITHLQVRDFGERDGMRSHECNGAFQPASWMLKNRSLVFPTMKGVDLVDPTDAHPTATPPHVVIQKVNVDGHIFEGAGPFNLAPGADKLEFSFAALTFISPDRVHYYYQLEGFDRGWADGGSRRSAFYTNVPPGTYLFHVYATDGLSIRSSTEAVSTVKIEAYFYQTSVFKLTCVIFAFCLAIAAYRMRLRQLRAGQQHLEALVLSRTEQLSASEKKFRQLAENIREVFWVMEVATATFSYVSPSFESLFGIANTSLLSNPEVWFGPLHPDDRVIVRRFREDIRNGALAELEYRLIKGDGVHWVRDRGFPILDASGKLERTVGVVEDITERKEAERVLRRSNDELEQCVLTRTTELLALNEALQTENGERRRTEEQLKKAKDLAEAANLAKGEFLANVSHEIRTPMNGIIGMTDLVLDTPLSNGQREYLQVAKNSAASLLCIIDDILDFSKIDAHKLTLKTAPMSLRECITGTLVALSARAMEKRLGLEHEVDAQIPDQVVGDANRLRQILINLVGNAIKFTSRGKVKVEVKQRERDRTGLRLEFCVEDTGLGIAKDQQGIIFEAFRQADGSYTREFGGTGLGLTISSQLAALMGGTIWVDSELGRGSRFYFTACFQCIEKVEKSAEPAEAAQLSSVNSPRQYAGLRVMVVEDNLVNQRLARAILEKKGHQVTVAGNGRIGVEQLQRCDWQVDCILMDVQMPEMDGLAATQEIRRLELERGSHVPIIALTAHALDRDRERCLAAGMDDYMTKPIKAEQLELLLSTLVQSPAAR